MSIRALDPDHPDTLRGQLAVARDREREQRWAVRGCALTLAKMSGKDISPEECVALLRQALTLATAWKENHATLTTLQRMAGKYEVDDLFEE